MIIDPKHISNREYYTSRFEIQDYDMYDFLKYAINHPTDHALFNDNKKNLILHKMEERRSTPSFAREIIKELRKTFYKNSINLHGMVGFTNDSRSHEIHRDSMDVLYLQVIGEVEWSIWNSDKVIRVFSTKLTPGDTIWIPRGIPHHVKPLSPRVGFSFGIEGDPEASEYADLK